MKIVSWNVNSIKARAEHVQRFLKETAPDVLMVQELKGLEFPEDLVSGFGYHVQYVGQKAYNGVAIISKEPANIILDHLPGDDTDEQARYLEVEINGQRIINIYLPNGNPVGTDKYDYKINWMRRLYDRLSELRSQNIEFIIGGDFNIIPEDKDCHDPKAWANDALFLPRSRQHFRALENLGLYDAFRILNKSGGNYSFWDYQAGAWQNDKGIRIDHFLLSPYYADHLKNCTIDRAPRGWDKPSDHTSVILEIAA